jgi:hypothetical protein
MIFGSKIEFFFHPVMSRHTLRWTGWLCCGSAPVDAGIADEQDFHRKEYSQKI